MHLNVDFDVEIERRDDFDATTERETISTQNICFLDVANAVNDCFDVTNDVSKSEVFEAVFGEITNDVDIDVDSFRDSLRDEDVAKNVDIAIIAFDVSIDATNDCFDVERDVCIAITASIAFNEDVTIFLANFVCCCNSVLCFLTRRSFSFSCSCESNF